MLTRFQLSALLSGLLLMAAASATAQSYSPSAIALLHAIEKQPTQLARYDYLVKVTPGLSASNQILARQFLAFSQSELGVYSQAVLSFPLQAGLPQDFEMPEKTQWVAHDALDVITHAARDRHIVLVNEAHHDAYTRVLILDLLPRLKALGFTYFAAEGLSGKDPGLQQRGYPVAASGTEYVSEPIYGEILREAARLGYTIVAYDTKDSEIAARETGQAENLYRQVFREHPQARLFVQTGYAHIDKAQGRLGTTVPMAEHLAALTGYEPLSVDQIEFLEKNLDKNSIYHQLVRRFPFSTAAVLINVDSGKPWSDRPRLYDMNVILPPVLDLKVFGDKHKFVATTDGTVMPVGIKSEYVEDYVRDELQRFDRMQRPGWLTLHGQRRPYPVNTAMCHHHVPCLVEARYAKESTDAVSADRYAFTERESSTDLYLRPGSYRLRATDVNDKTLSERSIEVGKP